MIGVQFTWTVELSYGTPYLLSLHIPQSLTALVWLAGPLSGLIVQPLIGAFSDKATFRWGRRRPFIVVGGFIVCVSMAAVAYAKEIGHFWVTCVLRHKAENGGQSEVDLAAIIVAVVSFFVLDFSLNAVQAGCRALIVDIPPIWQQEAANAWAARLNSVGMVVGYFAGFLDLPKLLPFLGSHQMKVFCVVAIFTLVFALSVTCISVHEEPFVADEDEESSILATFAYIWRAFRFLPRPIQKLCNVQFFAWMGWFPFLFYSTTWVANVYALTHDPNDITFWDEATRAGSFALFYYALVAVLAGATLPALTPASSTDSSIFTMKNLFTASHLVFGILMLSTFWVGTVAGATIVIALTGAAWAVQMWVPFAFVGEYVMGAEERKAAAAERRLLQAERRAGASDAIVESAIDDPADEFEAGMVLGVHNMYIVFPQFAVAIISAIIFTIAKTASNSPFDHDAGELSGDGVAWVLRFGGVMALFAAVASRWIEEVQIDKT